MFSAIKKGILYIEKYFSVLIISIVLLCFQKVICQYDVIKSCNLTKRTCFNPD